MLRVGASQILWRELPGRRDCRLVAVAQDSDQRFQLKVLKRQGQRLETMTA